MKWSWKIFEFRGISVYVHATFLILIAFVVMSHQRQDEGIARTLEGVAFILLLFTCVVLHEFGHALMAARYGIATRDITLLPIGGVARLERMPEKPVEELWVALAGPAVNVVIAAGLFAWLQVTAKFAPLSQISVTGGPFLERLMLVNIILVVFNMLPAFPMDGGRVLRAALASRMDYARATQIAASVGQAMALAFGLIGILVNPFLIFIALFVWIGAAQEAGMVQMKSNFEGISVLRAMITDFQTLAPDDPLQLAIDHTLAGTQQDFPVLRNGTVVGILTRHNLLQGLAQHGTESPVEGSMHREFQTVKPSEMLETAFQRLQDCHCRTMPVVENEQLVGVITMDNIGEFVAFQMALSSAPHDRTA